MGHCLGTVGMVNHGVTINLGSAIMYSPAIFQTYFTYHKDMDCCYLLSYILLYLFVLYLMTAMLQLIDITASSFLAW